MAEPNDAASSNHDSRNDGMMQSETEMGLATNEQPSGSVNWNGFSVANAIEDDSHIEHGRRLADDSVCIGAEGGGDGCHEECGRDGGSSGWSSASSSTPMSTTLPDEPRAKIKVTMSFMKAYKAMRGPGDIEPSPLFWNVTRRDRQNGDGAYDGPLELAGRDEVKLLHDVDSELIGDLDDHNGGGRQTVFYFEAPDAILPLFPLDLLGPEGEHSDSDAGVVHDHPLDHGEMDQGWSQANGPQGPEDDLAYVSDDDGVPSEVRISPAVFRALAVECRPDRIDTLRISDLEVHRTRRPATPQDKILADSGDDSHRNNIMPYCHRRQFDVETGEELSPVYRVPPGPVGATLWSPPGVTPERAGLFLLLLQAGQGAQQRPARGSGMSVLFQRMAPFECRALRDHLYGAMPPGARAASSSSDADDGVNSASPCSSDAASSTCHDTARDSSRTITYTWSEVNDVVNRCRFDPSTASLIMMDNANAAAVSAAVASSSPSPSTSSLSSPMSHSGCPSCAGSSCVENHDAAATERALLETFRTSWAEIQAGRAVDAQLVAANERVQVALTDQARCLAGIEDQLAACRAAVRAHECAEAQAHYARMCAAERVAEYEAARVAQASRRHRRRQHRIVCAINEHLRGLCITAREMQARLAQERELQAVLVQKLRDGEARLRRLCREHGTDNAAELSQVLADKLRRLTTNGGGGSSEQNIQW